MDQDNLGKKELDFLAIGDTVVDAFIKIDNAHVTCKVDNTACELCIAFGAKVPYESVDVLYGVGNSANASVSAARLGLRSGLVTFLGDDINGRECVESFKHEGVDTECIILEKDRKTNYHYVLWFGDERTILIKHETFKTYLPKIKTPKWVYLSSFGEHAIAIHDELVKYIDANPNTKLAFQPGTFQIKLGVKRLEEIYKRSEYFCCNVEEAELILSHYTDAKPDHGTRNIHHMKYLLNGVKALGPKIITITDGKYGAYMYANERYYFMPNYPDLEMPFERTGAGDAFASTFAAMLALDYSPEDAIAYAPINSMNVVRFVGAQKGLLSRQELESFYIKAPTNYKIESL